MKVVLFVILIFPLVISACARVTPVAPSALSRSLPGQGSPSVGVALVVFPANPSISQLTTFAASALSSADATLDFGDGNQTTLKLTTSTTTLTHMYDRSGTFLATLTATNAVGQSASIETSVVVQ
jgi:hypothetical protein